MDEESTIAVVSSDGSALSCHVPNSGTDLPRGAALEVSDRFGRTEVAVTDGPPAQDLTLVADWCGERWLSQPDDALAWIINAEEATYIVPDCLGRVPILLSAGGAGVRLSTSLRGLWHTRRGIDRNRLALGMLFGYVPSGETVFDGIYWLRPDRFYLIDLAGRVKQRAATTPLTVLSDVNEPDSVSILTPLRESLSRAYERPGDVLLSLSGGLDSRLLAALAKDLSFPLRLLTYGSHRDYDVMLARKVASRLGAEEHGFRELTPHGLQQVAANFAGACGGVTSVTHARCMEARQGLPRGACMVNGFAGDLTLGGGFQKRRMYEMDGPGAAAALMFKRLQKVPLEHVEASMGVDGKAITKLAHELFASFFRSHTNGSAASKAERAIYCSKACFETIWTARPYRQECVALPFLNLAAALTHLRVAARDRYKHTLHKELLRREFPELAQVAWQKTGASVDGVADPDLANPGLSRRTPYEEWFAGELRPWIISVISRCDWPSGVNVPHILDLCSRGGDFRWADSIGFLVNVALVADSASQ